jgi:FKBP-type peptidyl-prolyl cis-trans isomerase
MKNLFIVAIAATVALASCQTSKNPKSFTTLDSLSYAAGVQVGTNLKMQDSTLNGDILAASLAASFKGKNTMTLEEANQFIQEWFTIRKPALDAAANQEWFDKLKAENPNIQTTPSGLMYEIINQGDAAAKPSSVDQVMVNYALSLKDGKLIQENDSISFALNRVIPGWTEGMQLIGKGGEIVLWVPAELGYGAQASGPIPANSALKFEVKLLDVIPAAAQ